MLSKQVALWCSFCTCNFPADHGPSTAQNRWSGVFYRRYPGHRKNGSRTFVKLGGGSAKASRIWIAAQNAEVQVFPGVGGISWIGCKQRRHSSIQQEGGGNSQSTAPNRYL